MVQLARQHLLFLAHCHGNASFAESPGCHSARRLPPPDGRERMRRSTVAPSHKRRARLGLLHLSPSGALPVKLIGRYMSPFVRRVGVSLHLLDIPFTNEPLSVLTDSLKIANTRRWVECPRWCWTMAGADRQQRHPRPFRSAGGRRATLLPLSGAERSERWYTGLHRRCLRKTVAAYYERDRRPEGLVWDDCTAIAKTGRAARCCWMHAGPSAASGPAGRTHEPGGYQRGGRL